nr:olfactory receptor 135 [Microplitis mediator]
MENISTDTYRRLLDIYITALRFTGIWPLLPSAKTGWKIFNFTYRFFNLALFIFYLIALGTDALDNVTDLTIFGCDGCFFFGTIMIMFKAYKFNISYDKILMLIDHVYDPIRLLSRTSDSGIIMSIKNCIFQERLEISFFCVSCSMFALTVIFLVPREKGALPIRCIYPFDTIKSPNHEIVVLHQSYAMVYSLVVLIAMDAMTVGFIRWSTIQIQVLTSNYKNCNVHSIRRATLISPLLTDKSVKIENNIEIFDEDTEICEFLPFYHNEIENIVEDSFFSRFRTCIKNHQRIIEMINELNQIFSSSMLVQFATSTAIICLNGFQLIVNSNDTSMFMKFFSYWISCFAQLLFWCWYGNQFTYLADTLTYNQWMSGWEYVYEKNKNIELRNLVTISMIPTLRPLEFKAVGLFVLSMPTFLIIVKSSYSILVLLTSVTTD